MRFDVQYFVRGLKIRIPVRVDVPIVTLIDDASAALFFEGVRNRRTDGRIPCQLTVTSGTIAVFARVHDHRRIDHEFCVSLIPQIFRGVVLIGEYLVLATGSCR
jgi:hypothetical protein